MSKPFRVVIPARYESSRLPGKVLLPIAGRPMLQHVWERACASGASDIVIATDNAHVAAAAEAFGAQICMTSGACQSGTDRVAEVCVQLGWADTAPVVNVQGDAPLMPPASIASVAQLLIRHSKAAIATLCTPLETASELHDANVVKVVFDRGGKAMYFSRAAIPAVGHGSDPDRALALAYRHLGLYAYRPDALLQLSNTPPCELEQLERLEQLRALWLGMEIRVAVETESHGPDVDTREDLQRVEALLQASGSR